MITNITDEEKTIVDFATETPHIIEEFKEQYDWHKDDPQFCQAELVKSAKENNITFKPGEQKYCVFGDEQRTLIGQVYDYMLRECNGSKSFTVKFEEYLR
jgi:hypothetical protein